MTTELHFRSAKSTDWPHITKLLTSLSLPLDGAEAHLQGFSLAFRDERLVGCAALERYGTIALLRSVAVAESERGRGLGGALVRQALEQAKTEGIHTIVLLTETARDFFPRFGFRPINRGDAPRAALASVEFQTACPASATVMQLDF